MIDRIRRIVLDKEPTAFTRTGGRSPLFTAAFMAVLVAAMPACTWQVLSTGKIGAGVYIDRVIFSGMDRGTPVALAVEAVRGSKDAFWFRKRADISCRGWIWQEEGMKPLVSKQWTKRVDPAELVCPHDEFIFARSMEDRITFTIEGEEIEAHLTTEAFYEDFLAESLFGYSNAGVAAAELTLNGRRIKGFALSERIHKKTDMSVLGAPHRVEIEARGTTAFLWEREGDTWLVRAVEGSGSEEGAVHHSGDLFHKDSFERVSQMKNPLVKESGDGWVIEADFGGWQAVLTPLATDSGVGPFRNVTGSLVSDGAKREIFGVLKVPVEPPLPTALPPLSEE